MRDNGAGAAKGIMETRGISKDEIAGLPLRRYEGEVRLVATAEDLAVATADIGQERVVGFDTETRPSFHKGESHPPALVQVATAARVYLFQLRHRQCHERIAAMLSDAALVKSGIGVAYDLRELATVFPFTPRNVVDLGQLARRRGLTQTGLRNLAGLFLGFRIPKGAKTTNWGARELTAAQITYAATDAWACRELHLRFEHLGLMAET
jgi:ribonuclease D